MEVGSSCFELWMLPLFCKVVFERLICSLLASVLSGVLLCAALDLSPNLLSLSFWVTNGHAHVVELCVDYLLLPLLLVRLYIMDVTLDVEFGHLDISPSGLNLRFEI